MIFLVYFFWTSLNFLNQLKFFKPGWNFLNQIEIFKPVYFFFGHLSIKKGKYIHSSMLFSPILADFLLIYSIPQLLYPFPPHPHWAWILIISRFHFFFCTHRDLNHQPLDLLTTVITTWPWEQWVQDPSYLF